MKSRKTRGMPRIKRTGAQPPPEDSDKAVGKRLRYLRLAEGKTQEEIGKIVGVGVPMISMCENGKGRLSADHMIKLLKEFDVPLEYLYLGWKRHLSKALKDRIERIEFDT
jgi:transcriptional regulator with XRE-family HTH domain